MKKLDYRELDYNHLCVDCNRPLKKNLVNKNPKAIRCNVCTKLRSGSTNFNRKKYLEKQRKNRVTYNYYNK